MSREALIRDVSKDWEMTHCRSLVVPGEETKVELPAGVNVNPEDVLRAQRFAGSLIWFKESISRRYAGIKVLKWNNGFGFAV